MANNISSLKQKKIQATSPKDDWKFIAKSYLAMAQVGAHELLEQKYLTEKKGTLYSVSNSAYGAKLLLVPILWCIKHAIEVMLKAHDVTFSSSFFKTHDLSVLKDILVKALKINSKDEHFGDIVRVVDKYYKMSVFNGKLLEGQAIYDIDNDFLRYPEGSNVVFKLNLHNLQRITKEEIQELTKDINLINLRINIPAGYRHLKPYWEKWAR